MPELNENVPLFDCLVRAEYLHNMEDGHGEFEVGTAISCTSIPGRAVGFQVLLNNGALIDRLPVSALCWKTPHRTLPLHYLQLWDCFSYDVAVIEYSFLHELRCDVLLKDKSWHSGIYKFTIDWYGNRMSDDPGEGQHKSGHVVFLDDGQIAIQPNNRLRWYEPSFVTKPFPSRPSYKTNSHIWSCENQGPKWVTEDSDRYFYETEEEPAPYVTRPPVPFAVVHGYDERRHEPCFAQYCPWPGCQYGVEGRYLVFGDGSRFERVVAAHPPPAQRAFRWIKNDPE